MTSVQNRPRLLSGNNISLIALLFLFTACDLFTPIQTPNTGNKDKEEEEELGDIRGGKVYNPETGEYEDAETVLAEEMITIRWEEVSTSDYQPIGSDRTTPIDDEDGIEDTGEDEENADLRDSYNVTMLLPFLTNRFKLEDAELDRNSLWAVQFYAGAKLAFDELEEEGINLNVSVLDTEANPSTVARLLQDPSVQTAHMIMGGVKKSCTQRIANHAKIRQVPHVSPYIASQGIADKNPYYIQIKPTLPTHLDVTTQHIKSNYSQDQIVLVRREDEREAKIMNYIQQLHKDITGGEFVTPLSEAIIDDKTANLENFDIQPILKPGRETVFWVTSWADKSFVYSFLQKAFNASRDLNHKITIYGMPQWEEYRDADYEYYEKLNLHISSEQYVDSYAADVRDFKQSYFDRYGAAPTTEAFRGYDDMLYFGRLLQKYGVNFQNYLSEAQADAFHTRFELSPVTEVTVDDFGQEQYGEPERFENQFVYILEFDNYHFQPAK